MSFYRKTDRQSNSHSKPQPESRPPVEEEDWEKTDMSWMTPTVYKQEESHYPQSTRTMSGGKKDAGYSKWDSKRHTSARNKDDGWGDSGSHSSNAAADDNEQCNDIEEEHVYGPGKECTRIVKVPNSVVGLIIGKGGATVRRIEETSLAKVEVKKPPTTFRTIIHVKGSDDCIEHAVRMIREVTKLDRREKFGDPTKKNIHPLKAEHERKVEVVQPEFPPEEPLAPAPAPFFTTANNQQNGSGSGSGSDQQPAQEMGFKEALEIAEREEAIYWAQFGVAKKDFYVELPEVAARSAAEVAAIRLQKNNIVVKNALSDDDSIENIPKIVTSFYEAFHNYPEILEMIKKVGFVTPSPIQCQSWPILMKGHDMIGIAQTGTGKTLAFLMPLFIHLTGQPPSPFKIDGPRGLILAPTRELAIQIDKEVKKYTYKNISSICIYGGADRKAQIAALTASIIDIIIATPGRLDDLVKAGYIKMEFVTYVVLDEADRMLDMGFEPQIRKSLYRVRPTRQTVMTSATWPEGVRRLAKSYTKDPIQVYVGSLDLAAVHSVTQSVLIIDSDPDVKFTMLTDFIRSMKQDEKAIIFCGKKARASYISSELALMGFDVASIHGDLEQYDREQAIDDITDGTVQILIATDVASRGIDITDLTHVINYDFPRTMEEYVHRVGRTGRAGLHGQSMTFFTWEDRRNATELIKILEEADQDVPHDLRSMAARWERRQKEQPEKRRFGGYGGRRY